MSYFFHQLCTRPSLGDRQRSKARQDTLGAVTLRLRRKDLAVLGVRFNRFEMSGYRKATHLLGTPLRWGQRLPFHRRFEWRRSV